MPKLSAAERQRPRPGDLCLDHVVHAVPDPHEAARVLEALGFVVTPALATADGTMSRSVMLEEGSIELVHRPRASASIRHFAFGAPLAEAEHQRLAAHGFAPPPVAQCETMLDGQRAHSSIVRLPSSAFPDSCVEFIERHQPEALWQPRYLAHRNGVQSLAAVIVCADDPAETGARLAHLGGMLPRRDGTFVQLETARGLVLVGGTQDCAALFGNLPAASTIAGYVIACDDPEELAGRCEHVGLEVLRRGACYVTALPEMLGGRWVFGDPGALRGAFSLSPRAHSAGRAEATDVDARPGRRGSL